MQLFANNASAALASGITASATTLTVTAGQGARFPAVVAPDFLLLTLNAAAPGAADSGNTEIVRCTAHASGSDTFTVERAQEPVAGVAATAFAFAAGAKVEARLTSTTMSEREEIGLRGLTSAPGGTPPTGSNGRVYLHNSAGRPMLSVEDGAGFTRQQPNIFANRVSMFLPGTGTALAAANAWGGVAGWTATGTISHPVPSSTFPLRHTRFTSAAAVHAAVGIMPTDTTMVYAMVGAGTSLHNGYGGWFFVARWLTGSGQGTSRWFIGLTSRTGVTTLPVTADPSTHATVANGSVYAGLLADSTDTTFQFATKDGTNGTKVNTGVTKAVSNQNTLTEFTMYCPPGGPIGMRLRFVLNYTAGAAGTDSGVVQIATTLPPATQGLRPTLGMTAGAIAAAEHVNTAVVYLETPH